MSDSHIPTETQAASPEPQLSVQSLYPRLLVPLDGGAAAESALAHAVALACAFGSELVLLRVVPLGAAAHVLPIAPWGEVGGAPIDPFCANALVTAETEAQVYLETAARPLRARTLRVTALVKTGLVADQIIATALEQKIALLVMAADEPAALRRLVLGSVTDEVLRRASCPVFLVRVAPVAPAVPPSRPEVAPGYVRNFREDASIAGTLAPKPLGLRTVDLARIVGSVGRAQELALDFRPVHRRRGDEQRFQGISDALRRGETLPPVELYKLGYNYYVLDGNHRVAAAKHLGQVDIDADVTEFIPVNDEEQQRVFTERRKFEHDTGLTRVGARRPGHYPRLEQSIRQYAAEVGMAETVDDEATLKEAARSWYSNVFYPMADRLRGAKMGDVFPDDRTADIFIYLADFRDRESTAESRQLSWDEALDRFLSAHGHARSHVFDQVPGLRLLLRGKRE